MGVLINQIHLLSDHIYAILVFGLLQLQYQSLKPISKGKNKIKMNHVGRYKICKKTINCRILFSVKSEV